MPPDRLLRCVISHIPIQLFDNMQYLHRFFFTLYLFSLFFFFLNNNDEAVFIIAILPIYFVYIFLHVSFLLLSVKERRRKCQTRYIYQQQAHILFTIIICLHYKNINPILTCQGVNNRNFLNHT